MGREKDIVVVKVDSEGETETERDRETHRDRWAKMVVHPGTSHVLNFDPTFPYFDLYFLLHSDLLALVLPKFFNPIPVPLLNYIPPLGKVFL